MQSLLQPTLIHFQFIFLSGETNQHKTRGKITILCILMSKILDRGQEDKKSLPDWQ